MANFVLLHGAFHGGWCWRFVAERLRAHGHNVTTPTQTGVGERKHLLSRTLTLDSFTDDLVHHIAMEDLSDIILVGHSFGGSPISGAADQMPERIRHLVYLDARVLENGQAPFDLGLPEINAARRQAAMDFSDGLSIPPPTPLSFGVPDGPLAEWVLRHLTPHPLNTFETKLTLRHPVGNGRPKTYIACTAPLYPSLADTRAMLRERADWHWREIATGHDAMVTAPEELTTMLEEIAA